MEPERKSIKGTSLLSQSIKGPKTCYGATRKPETNTADYKLVAHNLTLSDTLQGLAIKYGVTVEQIRRVNKLWSSDNILIFKTINIPVKLTYDNDGLTENIWDKPRTSRNNAGSSKNTKVQSKTQECDSEESVDSGVHDVNHGDISVDIKGHSGINSPSKAKDSSSNSECINSFLKKLDGQMKDSIQNDKKQRANSVLIINNLNASHEEERFKRYNNGSDMRLKKNHVGRTLRSSQSLDEDSGSLDNLFEL